MRQQRKAPKGLDFHTGKECYAPDLTRFEAAGIVAKGTVVVADNVGLCADDGSRRRRGYGVDRWSASRPRRRGDVPDAAAAPIAKSSGPDRLLACGNQPIGHVPIFLQV